MLLWAHMYAPGDFDIGEEDFIYDQESKGELAAAQAIVEAILEHNDLFLEDIQPEPFSEYRWLSSIGEGDDWSDWRDPGKATLAVPDMRGYFTQWKETQGKGRGKKN